MRDEKQLLLGSLKHNQVVIMPAQQRIWAYGSQVTKLLVAAQQMQP
jgi:hypothetical protein